MQALRALALALPLGSALAVAAWSPPAMAGGPWATDEASFLGAHLQEADFPTPMDIMRPQMNAGCGFAKAQARGCMYESHNQWINPRGDEAIHMVHDLRWVFPDAAAAKDFYDAAADELRENLSPVSQPPQLGDESMLYSVNGDYGGLGIKMVMYNLVFRVDNVVVKVFVSQGPEVEGQKLLTPLLVASLGTKAIARIKSTQPGQGAAAPVPTPEATSPASEPEPAPPAAEDPDEDLEQVEEVEEKRAREPKERRERERPRRSRSRTSVRDYWRDGKLDEPVLFVGGDYASTRGLGEFTLDGRRLAERYQFDISVGYMMHPRIYFQMSYHRDLWGQDEILDALFSRFEFIYMLDLLALPNDWRLRPALMAMAGVGLGWGRVEAVGEGLDPMTGAPISVNEVRGLGIGGIFGGEFALHLRLTDRVEFAPFAGITIPGYRISDDHPYAERTIDGERGFGRAWRWHVGAKIGFSID